MSKNNIVIIGGGIAGLSAALHLAELGMTSTIIEAASYPQHKICGEFFSPESLPLLQRWNITLPILINSITHFAAQQNFTFQFPQPAGSMSHYFFDADLVHQARNHGVIVREQTEVKAITKNNGEYILHLANKENSIATHLLIGAGRATALLNNNKQMPAPKFMGIKAHFKYHQALDQILFYTFKNAYVGLCSVAADTVNIAGIAKIEEVKKYPSVEHFINHLASQSHAKMLKTIMTGECIFPAWMTSAIPGFGMRNNPTLPNVFFIGDAAGAIPPATGDGLSIALLTGKLVAEYVKRNDAAGFKTAWQKQFGPIFRNGKILHHGMMNPMLTAAGINICKILPWLPKQIYKVTRNRHLD